MCQIADVCLLALGRIRLVSSILENEFGKCHTAHMVMLMLNPPQPISVANPPRVPLPRSSVSAVRSGGGLFDLHLAAPRDHLCPSAFMAASCRKAPAFKVVVAIVIF